VGPSVWHVRLGATAQEDYQDVLRWTVEQFGIEQARTYAETLAVALEDLCAGPGILGVRARDEIRPNFYTLHVARKGRRGRHFVLFRTGQESGKNVIDVLRILHDSMDLHRQLPADDMH